LLEEVNSFLRAHHLPECHNEIVLFEVFAPQTEAIFPNSKLVFTDNENHILICYNDNGLSECFQVMRLELDTTLYSPSSENDPKFKEFEVEDLLEIKRYSAVTIGDVRFEKFSPELMTAFLLHRTATLHTHPVSKI